MVYLKNARGFSREYLSEIYNYKNSLNLEFFEERVWWWRLLETFEDDYKKGEGPLFDWADKTRKSLPANKRYYKTMKVTRGKRGNTTLHLGQYVKRPINFIKLFHYKLSELNYESKEHHLKTTAFEYEIISRLEGSYRKKKNWLEYEDPEDERRKEEHEANMHWYFSPEQREYRNQFPPSPNIVIPEDLIINLHDTDSDNINEFKEWLDEQRISKDIASPQKNKGKAHAWESWRFIEYFDVIKFDLEGYKIKSNGKERAIDLENAKRSLRNKIGIILEKFPDIKM